MDTLFSDLSQCEPSSALSRRREKACWQMIDYETDTFKGCMLFAGEEEVLPRLRLKLGLRGWHAVYLGLYATGFTQYPARVKLSGDPCYREFIRDHRDGHQLEEAFFKYADLTDQDLLIEKHQHDAHAPSTLAFVRCVVMSDAEVASMQAERARTDCRKLVVYNDGVGMFAEFSPRTEEEIWTELEPFRHSDAHTVCWGISTDHCFYPTRIGAVFGEGVEHFDSRDSRFAADSLRALFKQGINPIKSAAKFVHDMGMKFNIYYRMENFTCQPPHNMQDEQRLIGKHPEWRCLHRDGRPMVHMSYAYPGVRDYVVAMLEEVAPWGADGITLNYKRGAPFVNYEPPLIEGFKAQFGEDPRDIDEFDERWLKYRSGELTMFMRQLRQAMDRIGQAEGRRIDVTAISFATEAMNRYYGLELPLWLDEGLVDALAPLGDVHGCPEVDLAYYTRLLAERDCRFLPFLPVNLRFKTTGECIAGAHRYFTAGADGLSLWDCAHRESVRGPVLRSLGHVEQLDPEGKEPPVLLSLTVGDSGVTV